MRKLDADEKALWAKVVETVEPLSRDPKTRDVAAPTSSPARPLPPIRPRSVVARPRTPAPPSTARPIHEATLDGGWDRRLRSGKIRPDRVLDLHGHTLDHAWEAIDRGLDQAISAGERVVLLITGHAPKGEPPVKRGRIRGAVNDWLSASRHASSIAAVRGAAPAHGGRGAIYVILRRPGR